MFDWLRKLLGIKKTAQANGRKRITGSTAVISDIHGNLEALKAVEKEIRKQNIKNILFLGDLFGGPGVEINETIEEMKKLEKDVRRKSGEFVMIAGNGDMYALTSAGRRYLETVADSSPIYYSTSKYHINAVKPENKKWVADKLVRKKDKKEILLAAFLLSSKRSDMVIDPKLGYVNFRWTHKHITEKQRALLKKLGFEPNPKEGYELIEHALGSEILNHDAEVIIGNRVVHLSHGGPGPLFKSRIEKQFKPEEAFELLSDEVSDLLIGHNHITKEYKVDGKRIIQVGSVGAPRDKDPRASYAIIHGVDKKGQLIITHHKVPYDVNKTAKALSTNKYLKPEYIKTIIAALKDGEVTVARLSKK